MVVEVLALPGRAGVRAVDVRVRGPVLTKTHRRAAVPTVVEGRWSMLRVRHERGETGAEVVGLRRHRCERSRAGREKVRMSGPDERGAERAVEIPESDRGGCAALDRREASTREMLPSIRVHRQHAYLWEMCAHPCTLGV